ncbi:MAG: Coenzyme F420 hydrogenase/dehydrogenase, beta subunit C-terminal domain [bacterium]|nr:Coenzyme F420 hydrogenase/dehydrogenase, beta subunit C-terminal domain [bacterium]
MPEDPFTGPLPTAWVGRATDEGIYRNSQSGGVVTALLDHLHRTGAVRASVVAIMMPGNPPRGDVLLALDQKDLMVSQKSKYTPIPILKAIREIRKVDGNVAVVGLPCHIHGLLNLVDLFPELRKKLRFRIGLICDRIMTTAAIDFLIGKTAGKRSCELVFRDKTRPSYPGNVTVATDLGRVSVRDARDRIDIKDFFTPARCRICFDKMNIFSDVTVGDPHGIDGIDRINGESLVLVRSRVGRMLIESAMEAKAVILQRTDVDRAHAGQLLDKKRRQWESFAVAWLKISDVNPWYFDKMLRGGSSDRREERLLRSAMMLDEFKSRQSLLRYYERKLSLLRFRNRIHPRRVARLFKSGARV